MSLKYVHREPNHFMWTNGQTRRGKFSQSCEKRLLVRLVLSVRPSVIRMEQLGPQWMDFDGIWYLSIFRKSVEKIQVSLQSYVNNGQFTWKHFHIYDCLSKFSVEWEMFWLKVVVKIKTHILCSVTFLENYSVYEIMPKNVVEPEGPQTIWRMRVACWISKDIRLQRNSRVRVPTHTHAFTHPRAYRNM